MFVEGYDKTKPDGGHEDPAALNAHKTLKKESNDVEKKIDEMHAELVTLEMEHLGKGHPKKANLQKLMGEIKTEFKEAVEELTKDHVKGHVHEAMVTKLQQRATHGEQHLGEFETKLAKILSANEE